MVRRFLKAALLVVFFSVLFGVVSQTRPNTANAAINPQINFQGKLTNPDGTNVTNGTYSIVYSLYTVSSGGSNVWTETQGSVSVTDGIFNVILGSVTSLPGSVDFNSTPLYLGVKVGTDAEMTPRIQFTAAPYAFNADKIDGIDSTGLVQLAPSAAQTDSSTANPSIFINKTGATAKIVQLQKAAADVFLINNDGSVLFKGTGPSTTAFQVQNSSNAPLLLLDSQNNAATIGTASTGVSVTNNQTAGTQAKFTANAAPTVDQVAITNAGFGVTTAGVNGLAINFVGGAAAVEASGARVDLTPGTTSGGTWNGLRVVANATGAVAGVNEYGINLDGPTSPGAGNQVGITIDANWDAGLQLGTVTSEPGTPPTDNIYVYARKVAGRSLLRQKGSSGVSFAYQPALFEQNISYVGPNTGTTATSFGSSWTVDSTLSHPGASEAWGYIMNFATAATTGDTSGIAQTNNQWFRGSVAGGSNGFFFVARGGTPDTLLTSVRHYVGMASGTIASMTNADNPAGDFAGFQFSSTRGDTNWQFITKNNVTQNVVNTTMPMTVSKLYDFYIYVAPLGTTIFWRVDNLTDGTTQEGSTATNLPRTTISMKAGAGVQALSNNSRQIRIAKIYAESDR